MSCPCPFWPGGLFSNFKTKLRWRWLGKLKQPDGGFRICEGGEEDVRLVFILLYSCSIVVDEHVEARIVPW